MESILTSVQDGNVAMASLALLKGLLLTFLGLQIYRLLVFLTGAVLGGWLTLMLQQMMIGDINWFWIIVFGLFFGSLALAIEKLTVFLAGALIGGGAFMVSVVDEPAGVLIVGVLCGVLAWALYLWVIAIASALVGAYLLLLSTTTLVAAYHGGTGWHWPLATTVFEGETAAAAALLLGNPLLDLSVFLIFTLFGLAIQLLLYYRPPAGAADTSAATESASSTDSHQPTQAHQASCQLNRATDAGTDYSEVSATSKDASNKAETTTPPPSSAASQATPMEHTPQGLVSARSATSGSAGFATWEVQTRDGQRLCLPPGLYRLGRGPDCDIVFAGERVSRFHALLHLEQERGMLIDCDSEWGIAVDERSVECHACAGEVWAFLGREDWLRCRPMVMASDPDIAPRPVGHLVIGDQRLGLTGGWQWIGSTDRAHLYVDHASISAQHAGVNLYAGQVYLRPDPHNASLDASGNPLYDDTVIRDGDHFYLGDVECALEIAPEALSLLDRHASALYARRSPTQTYGQKRPTPRIAAAIIVAVILSGGGVYLSIDDEARQGMADAIMDATEGMHTIDLDSIPSEPAGGSTDHTEQAREVATSGDFRGRIRRTRSMLDDIAPPIRQAQRASNSVANAIDRLPDNRLVDRALEASGADGLISDFRRTHRQLDGLYDDVRNSQNSASRIDQSLRSSDLESSSDQRQIAVRANALRADLSDVLQRAETVHDRLRSLERGIESIRNLIDRLPGNTGGLSGPISSLERSIADLRRPLQQTSSEFRQLENDLETIHRGWN